MRGVTDNGTMPVLLRKFAVSRPHRATNPRVCRGCCMVVARQVDYEEDED